MGASYGSIHIRTENSDAVRKALDWLATEAGCKFLLGPALNGWISVFPNDSGQSDQISVQIAKCLPDDIFHLIVHDDDIFAYYFYRDSRLIDQYNSCPDYFEKVSDEEKQQCKGRPELFRDLLRDPESMGKLKTLLAADEETFTFEQERMAQFVELLGLENAESSYEYLQSGERDGINGWKQFVHIPDLTAEKAAKRAAQAQIKTEKKRLQKEGTLLAEIKPPKEIERSLTGSIAWGTDFSSNGLILAWNRFIRSANDNEDMTEFLTVRPPWKTSPQPLGLKTNWTADVFSMSPSASWLAGGFVAGDWKMRIWDWQRKGLSFEVTHTRAVQWVEFSRGEQLVYSLGGEEFIVSSMAEKRPITTVKGLAGARKAAVHPTGNFAAVTFQNQLGIIDLEKGQLIKKLWINRKMETLDPFARDAKGTLIRTCLQTFLENPKIRQKLGVDSELHTAILQDPEAIERLSVEAQQRIKSMVEKVRSRSLITFETKEHLFDVRFSPTGGQLFIAGNGMRVFDWNKLLAADEDAPSPELSIDAPKDDENDPNSRPLSYCVRFDPERNLLISSCLAGVIQYLNINNGQSGTLFKLPDEVCVWRFELTTDGKALCCHCSSRPKLRNLNKRVNYLQIWNYPALCKAAGLNQML